MEGITAEEAESVADEHIEEIEDVGYPDNWDIEKLYESTCDEMDEWLLFQIRVGSGDDDRIQVYYRREDRKTCIWVWVDGRMKRTGWGRGGEPVVEFGKQYLEEMREESS